MASFRVVGIPAGLSQEVRTTLSSPQYHHPAHVETAAGYGPCRSCLATFEEGQEERILFMYNPFAGLDPYPSPGPIFIHREECAAWEAESFPPMLRHLPLTFEGYGEDRWIVARERVADGEAERAIARLFADPAVRYIHVRNTEAGCFIARVERVSSITIPGKR